MAGITSLPQWAQAEIRDLERALKETRETLAGIYGEEDTDTSWDSLDAMRPLPKGSVVKFDLPRGSVRVYVDAQGRLNMNSTDISRSGTARMTVLPRSTNIIEIAIQEVK